MICGFFSFVYILFKHFIKARICGVFKCILINLYILIKLGFVGFLVYFSFIYTFNADRIFRFYKFILILFIQFI